MHAPTHSPKEVLMSHAFIRAAIVTAATVAANSLAPILPGLVTLHAQTSTRPVTTRSTEPSPLPRTPDGHPDLQGYWDGGPANASHSIEDGCCDAIHAAMQSRGPDRLGLPEPVIVDPPDGRIPYQSWAADRRREYLFDMETPTELDHIDPEDRCLLIGVPRSNYRGDLQIRQNGENVVVLYEWAHAYRIIPTHGRPHVGAAIGLFNGDSRGRWEGDTLVVETTNFNDEVWLDSHGSFHSKTLHVVERWRLIDADTIHYEATLEDPAVFERGWTLSFNMARITEPGYEFFEEACWEGVTNKHRLAAGRLAVAAGERQMHTHEPLK